MKKNLLLALLAFVGFLFPAQGQPSFPRVNADLEVYDQTVKNMKSEFEKTPANPHDIPWVISKLQYMFDVDQFMRKQTSLPYEHQYSEEEKAYFNQEFVPRFRAGDTENTDELKLLLKIYSWFVISRFGAVADNQAWIVVQHADEQPEFQKEILVILEGLYKQKETNPRNYAYLFDRVAASFADPSKRKLQRYGTQGTCVGPGLWEPFPMEEPLRVDQRRAEVGLGTLAEYKEMFKDICP